MQRIIHPIPPYFDADSKILILGSFPSIKSREVEFFYGHPQNRFWRVISDAFGETAAVNNVEKIAFLRRHHIAVWDVIASCEITGSSDSSIQNVLPNDLQRIVDACHIGKIFTNGKTADKLYDKYFKNIPIAKRCLPSTSPANARYSFEKLKDEWRIIAQ